MTDYAEGIEQPEDIDWRLLERRRYTEEVTRKICGTPCVSEEPKPEQPQ